jgi:hypothetical protein
MFSTKIFNASKEEREKYFIEKTNNKYPNCFDFSKVKYINKDTKVELICLKCKSNFYILPSQLNTKNNIVGCQKCNIKNRAINRSLTKENILSRIQKNWKVIDWNNYINSASYINIKCDICGIEHSSIINNLVKGLGCYNCYNKRRGNTLRLTKEKVIEKFNLIWGNEYDYSKVEYVSMWHKIKVVCKIHDYFFVSPHDHIDRVGCKKCSKKFCSKLQIDWIKFMEIRYNTKIIHAYSENGEYKIPKTRYRADGYSEELNMIFEFHGDYYHGNPKFYNKNDYNKVCKKTFGELYEKTIKKEEKIKELGYTLITIWEYQWKIFIKSINKIKINYKNKSQRLLLK